MKTSCLTVIHLENRKITKNNNLQTTHDDVVVVVITCTVRAGSCVACYTCYIYTYTQGDARAETENYLQSSAAAAAALSLLSGTDRGNALTERPQLYYGIPTPTGFFFILFFMSIDLSSSSRRISSLS